MKSIGKLRKPGETGPERMIRFKELLGKEYPPHPGPSVVPPATFKGYAHLPADDVRQCREILLHSWRSAACQAKGGVHLSLDPHGEKWSTKLDVGARALLRNRTKPAEWAMFSLHVWQLELPGRFPTLKFTWSRRRIRDRQEWFAEWLEGQADTRLLSSAQADSLMQVWSEMAADIANPLLPLETAGDARKILDTHFSGDRYERLVADAKAANKILERQIRDSRANGVFGIL